MSDLSKLSYTVFVFNSIDREFVEHEYHETIEDAMDAQYDLASIGLLSYVQPSDNSPV
jgi:hypothetical protein